MLDFENEIKNNKYCKVKDLVLAFKEKIIDDLEKDELLDKMRDEDSKLYMKLFEDKYPHFANKFPFLFDKIILRPHNLQFLDFLLEQLDCVTESNFDQRTQVIANVVAENRDKKFF